MIFEYVIIHSLLDAFDGGFLAERAGHQQERNVFSACAQFFQRFEATPARQTIVGQHGVKFSLLAAPQGIVHGLAQ